MTQLQYTQLLCVLLSRMSKLRNEEIRRWHRYYNYAPTCLDCGILALNARGLVCPKRKPS